MCMCHQHEVFGFHRRKEGKGHLMIINNFAVWHRCAKLRGGVEYSLHLYQVSDTSSIKFLIITLSPEVFEHRSRLNNVLEEG